MYSCVLDGVHRADVSRPVPRENAVRLQCAVVVVVVCWQTNRQHCREKKKQKFNPFYFFKATSENGSGLVAIYMIKMKMKAESKAQIQRMK